MYTKVVFCSFCDLECIVLITDVQGNDSGSRCFELFEKKPERRGNLEGRQVSVGKIVLVHSESIGPQVTLYMERMCLASWRSC